MSSDIIEVLFTCTLEDSEPISACDLRTGTNLMNYKGGGCVQAKSLCILGASEYLIAGNVNKPLLHVWPINAQEQITSSRFVMPDRVNSLAVSPDGCYLVAGVQENIYIWRLINGRMLNTISKHYQAITCLCFTDDSSYFASASKDGGVLVWNLTQAVSHSDDNNHVPMYSFNDHGLPVTDVHIGNGGIRAYMYTVSLDRSCKVYDLSSGNLLLSVVFAESLHSVTVNTLETCVYVGTAGGNINEFRIDAVPRVKEYHMEPEHITKFVGHKSGTAVNCLRLSLDGQTLVSGGADQQVCMWHIGSHQLIKAMTFKGAISNLSLRLTSPAVFHPEHKQPQRFAEQLRRMIDPPEADEDECIEVLVTESIVAPGETLINSKSNKTRNKATATSVNVSMSNNNKLNKTLAEDTEEVQILRAEIAKLKAVNKKLFETSARLLLNK